MIHRRGRLETRPRQFEKVKLKILLFAVILAAVAAYAGTPAASVITSGTTVTQGANPQAFYFQLTGTSVGYVLLGSGTATSGSCNFILNPSATAGQGGEKWQCPPFYKGSISLGFSGTGGGIITKISQ